MSKHQEMSEIGGTEFHFSDSGPRNPSNYIRGLANMSIGSPSRSSPDVNKQRPLGGGLAHALDSSRSSSKFYEGRRDSSESITHSFVENYQTKHSKPDLSRTLSNPKPKEKRRDRLAGQYFDLDDDWDANVDFGTAISRTSSRTSHRGHNSKIDEAAMAEVEILNSALTRIKKFEAVLGASTVNLKELKALAYNGVPSELRPRTWQYLLGYLPPTADRREATLARKRTEYLEGVKQVFASGKDHHVWHQISIDVPRTNPHIPLYSKYATQRSLERILYLWAMRHPASGYVQGINDLVTPFYQTFLSQHTGISDVENADPADIPRSIIDAVEADSYWCLTKLLDGIQDNYIHAQPGIHRQVSHLQELCKRIDQDLADHLESEGIQFMQFCFRWMNCLLMRELPMICIIRVWDTYLAEGSQGFSEFHVYVCAAFLAKWAKQLKAMDFQDIMLFLQCPPTENWTEQDIELILSEAYMWQSLYSNATAHLKN